MVKTGEEERHEITCLCTDAEGGGRTDKKRK